MNTSKQPYGTVLIKADRILGFLSSCEKPQPLNIIAKETELTNSTALKILDTLLLIGYVHKDPETKKFSLGTKLIKYANKSINQLDIKQIAHPYLVDLQQKTTETVHLGILDDSSIVYVSKIESKNPICLYSQLGKHVPLYCSAMGKAIIAEHSDEEIEKYLRDTPLTQRTSNTITSKENFLREITRIRALGYAFDNSENEDGVFCVGTTLTTNNKNYGAISVSVPQYRVTEDFLQEMIGALQTCRRQILGELP
ncbi:IclR family transcriptional regulator [Mesobacillus foraminis]|uniref:IclR family transcriptional regulator n=1 Tax=Mesobacillus foraminis TaxID=279826 RepID=UPI000EF4AD75|nr:IclR family transcriptional regulator [Mesobacillus foraminis]